MGSCTHIVDDRKILNQYEYDAWGNVVSQKETVKNRFKFNGQQLDPITQQYYLRARFYNPVIARFTQEDTYRGDGLNLYDYCANNPVYYVDPSGNACEPQRKVYEEAIGKNPLNGKYLKNWKGEDVKIPEGHILSPRDLDFSKKPIIEDGPYTTEQRNEFLKGNAAGTKLAPHHRHQIPVRDGGVIDEIPGPGHPSGNQHTGGSPSRHPAKSIFNSEPNGNKLRADEINQHWKDKGNRLIEKEPGVWKDPGV